MRKAGVDIIGGNNSANTPVIVLRLEPEGFLQNWDVPFSIQVHCKILSASDS
jgi:hypothetical protein